MTMLMAVCMRDHNRSKHTQSGVVSLWRIDNATDHIRQFDVFIVSRSALHLWYNDSLITTSSICVFKLWLCVLPTRIEKNREKSVENICVKKLEK